MTEDFGDGGFNPETYTRFSQLIQRDLTVVRKAVEAYVLSEEEQLCLLQIALMKAWDKYRLTANVQEARDEFYGALGAAMIDGFMKAVLAEWGKD